MKALVTGASSGMGRDMAKILSEKGYDLVIVARNEDGLIELKEELKTSDIKVVKMDLSSEENCRKLFEDNKDIDLLINNAGFGVFGLFEETDIDKELKLIDTNIRAVHILTKLYLREMKKKNSGKILNVSSIGGMMPGPLMASYYASKAYVYRLSLAIKEELRREKSKVKISVLCPGPVKTNFSKVAGVDFQIASMDSEKVARYTIKKLENGVFCIIPGMLMKMTRVACKIVPDAIVARFTYKVQKRKISK